MEGRAEIFGGEMPLQKPLQYSGCKLAVFSYEGCKISVKNSPETEYTSSETPMHVYLHFHLALESLRNEAFSAKRRGPIVCYIIENGS